MMTHHLIPEIISTLLDLVMYSVLIHSTEELSMSSRCVHAAPYQPPGLSCAYSYSIAVVVYFRVVSILFSNVHRMHALIIDELLSI